MNRISLLSKEISGRIAAGEVVVNPASVVKELVENSIDSGAKSITVEIKNGGIDYIRVTDNGSGIHKDDMLLSVTKHATSKISSFEDIHKISSLGFRGEALSSICAVSHVTIKSKTKTSDEGRILTFNGSEPVCKPAGVPEGTTVICENLFYNIPARLKNLKKSSYEAVRVADLMSRFLLSHSDISFKYIQNGQLVYKSGGSGNLKDAVMSVYGSDIVSRIEFISAVSENYAISGYVSNNSYFLRSQKQQSIFVNGRYVQSKAISNAINAAYSEKHLKGHYPFAAVFISLPFDMVDVNIHPSKTTILISEEEKLCDFITSSIKNALNPRTVNVFKFDEEKSEYQPFFEYEEEKNSYENAEDFWRNTFEDEQREHTDAQIRSMFEESDIKSEKMQFNESAAIADFADFTEKIPEKKQEKEEQTVIEIADFADYKIIGTAFDTYILVQAEEKIYVIDQHALHERINYERIKNSESIKGQMLLVPQVIKLTPEDCNLIIGKTQFLSSLGFEMDDFGINTIKVSSAPLRTGETDLRGLIDDIINEIKVHKNDPVLMRDYIIRKSCRSSIKAGYKITNEEIKSLINEISKEGFIPNCPHGRPVAFVITKDEIEKGFKRRV